MTVDIAKAQGTVLLDTNDSMSVPKIYATVLLDAGGICPHVSGYLPIPDRETTTVVGDVIGGVDDNIQAGSGADEVITSSEGLGAGSAVMKYLAVIPQSDLDPLSKYSFTYSLYKDDAFKDWFTVNLRGTDAAAFLVTGYETMQDTQRNKKVSYMTAHFEQTENSFTGSVPNLIADDPSGCLVQSQWEWADSAASGRFGNTFQAYRLSRAYIPTGATDPFDYGFSVVTTRNKLRGKGRALSLKFSTENSKNCKIIGWSLNITGETKV